VNSSACSTRRSQCDDHRDRDSGRRLFLGRSGAAAQASGSDLDARRVLRRIGGECHLPQPRGPRRGCRGQISYRDILEFFFQIHDPSTKDRQGNDIGSSYRSAIFYTSEEQKTVALDTIKDVDASGLWPGPVVTEVTAAGPFWEAEEEHQDYLIKNPYGYTCHYVRPGWKLPRREEVGA
jgi:hypothetical protein